jgi:hypothetical protein
MNADTGVPDILLERYRLNELPNDETDRLAALLAHDSRLRERLRRSRRQTKKCRAACRIGRGARGGLGKPRRGAVRCIGRARSGAALVAISVRGARRRRKAGGAVGGTNGSDQGPSRPGALSPHRRGQQTLADGAVARKDLIRIGYRPAGH